MVRKGKGVHEEGREVRGGYTGRQPVEPVNSSTVARLFQVHVRLSSVCLSVDWRHIFGRDNAAQLIFLSPVSISRN